MDLFSKLSLTCGGNVNHYKSAHHPILTLHVGTGNTLAIFKTNQEALFSTECPGIFLLGQSEEERKAFIGGCKKKGGGRIERLPQEHLVALKDEKVCSFVKFEVILPLLCCLLDPLTNKQFRG